MLKIALQKSLEGRTPKVLWFTLFVGSVYLYALAIESTGSIETFINHSPFLILAFQIFFSLLNSALFSTSIVMLLYVFKQRQKGDGKAVSVIQSVVALFFSVTTTGCYVCGTVLFPVVGIASAFAALPFGGIEVKFLTTLLLIYSILDLSKKVLGICKVDTSKTVEIIAGSKIFKFQTSTLTAFRQTAITFTFVALIFVLPAILPSGNFIKVDSQYVCLDHAGN
ncbi:MAG: hypothetical protein Kow0081_4980 [Candidatus Dojkabacteria bacterium]